VQTVRRVLFERLGVGVTDGFYLTGELLQVSWLGIQPILDPELFTPPIAPAGEMRMVTL
jgi:hypothetical protein